MNQDTWRVVGLVMTIVVVFWLHEEGEKAKLKRDQALKNGTTPVTSHSIDLFPEGR